MAGAHRFRLRGTACRGALAILALALFLVSCRTGWEGADPVRPAPGADLALPPLPDARFMVISDLHYLDPQLGSGGAALDRYLAHDRKLLVESRELLGEAVKRILAVRPQFVLVPGDLTKDGELLDHRAVAAFFDQLRDAGVAVFVIVGKHYINNPHARRFEGEKTIPVDRTDPAAFAAVYDRAGYGSALARDPASLSYVAEPVPGLWLVAVDTVRWEENPGRADPVVGGSIRPQTAQWLRGQFAEARRQGKALVVMQHHGVVEHFRGQADQFPDYLVDEYPQIARWYAANGVRLVFTGHFHANDIAGRRWSSAPAAAGATGGQPAAETVPAGSRLDGRWLLDIETGSLVTWPCRLRSLRISGGELRIASDAIGQLPSFAGRGEDFSAYARDYIGLSIKAIAKRRLAEYGSLPEEAEILAAQISAATIAHYRGNERFAANDPEFGTGAVLLGAPRMGLAGSLLVGLRGYVMEGMWNDPAPADNFLLVRPDGHCETLPPDAP